MNSCLKDVLVVAIEQAVAAPYCTNRLREGGARVIKIERPDGDFARGYDNVAGGDSSYFFWLNQGKESLTLDFKQRDDAALLHRLLSKADVLVQNLAPGALARAGFDLGQLRERYSQLITCDISGYGSSEQLADMKAYDLLVQGESGLVSVSSDSESPNRIGVSICDIGAGMTAHAGILEALLERQLTGRGKAVEVSLFGVAADWMTVPLLHNDYGGKAPAFSGLNHPSIAPYGGYRTGDGEMVIIAIQNEREWKQFCTDVLESPDTAEHPDFNSNTQRVANRSALDQRIHAVTERLSGNEVVARLKAGRIAYGFVNSVASFSAHAGLARRSGLSSTGESISFPVRPVGTSTSSTGKAGEDSVQVPTIGQHNSAIRREFE